MALSFHINDFSNPEVNAFIEYIKSLSFITVEDEFVLSDEQVVALKEAEVSLNLEGGVPHQEVMASMRKKYPWAFSE
jgi:hypothetical protein